MTAYLVTLFLQGISPRTGQVHDTCQAKYGKLLAANHDISTGGLFSALFLLVFSHKFHFLYRI